MAEMAGHQTTNKLIISNKHLFEVRKIKQGSSTGPRVAQP
jgi:hypothetical protein